MVQPLNLPEGTEVGGLTAVQIPLPPPTKGPALQGERAILFTLHCILTSHCKPASTCRLDCKRFSVPCRNIGDVIARCPGHVVFKWYRLC